MQRILKELYYGNIPFASHVTAQDSAFVKAAQAKHESLEKLKALLDDTGKELFEAYCDAESDIEDIMRYNTFTSAMRFATLFMIEVFTLNDPNYEGGELE